MINIDQYAYSSKLKQKNPMEKMVFALLTLSVCLWANSLPVSIAVLLLMAWGSVYKGGMPLSLFLKLMSLPMTFLILGVVTIAVQINADPQNLAVSIPLFGTYLGISQTGFFTAVNIFFRALGTVSCLYYLSLNTPMVDILTVLRKLKCPKLLIELMSLIYRFIFVLLDTMETMVIAQKSRLGYSSLTQGYRSLGALSSTLFVRAYKRSDELFTALEARGYDGELNVLEETFSTSLTGYCKIVGINLILIIFVVFS